MSPVDAVMPLLQTPWTGRHGKHLPIVPLPGIRQEAITNLEAHWTGVMTPEMRRILQRTCGQSSTPLGGIEYNGRSFPAEQLSKFSQCNTLPIERYLGDFLERILTFGRRESMATWLTTLYFRARKVWASRLGRAFGVP